MYKLKNQIINPDKMKPICKVIILVVMLMTVTTLKSQTFKAVYTYDANGNRITANVIYLSSSPSNASANSENEVKVDLSTELSVKIYPNPTQGDLKIEITGGNCESLNNTSNCIKVWDMVGKMIINLKSISEMNSVDLTSCSKGAYIMHITINGKTKDYKIIKN